MRASQLSPTHILDAAAQYEHLAQWTRFGTASAMRRLLRYLHDCGAADFSRSVPKVTLPAPRDVTVTDAERDLILNAAPMHLRLWVLLCADLALRSGTAAKVAPQHYNPERREISIRTKAGRLVVLPTTDEIERLFNAIPRNADAQVPYVHHLHPLHHVCLGQLRQTFWRLRKSLGIQRQIWPHDLRRTAAVRAYKITGDLRMVQALLGHSQLRSTLHYLDHRNVTVPRELVERGEPYE